MKPDPHLTAEEIRYYESQPPIALEFWIQRIGKAPATVARWREQGMLKTENLYGKLYVLAIECVRFNRRLAAGEFAGEIRAGTLKSSRNSPRTDQRAAVHRPPAH